MSLASRRRRLRALTATEGRALVFVLRSFRGLTLLLEHGKQRHERFRIRQMGDRRGRIVTSCFLSTSDHDSLGFQLSPGGLAGRNSPFFASLPESPDVAMESRKQFVNGERRGGLARRPTLARASRKRLPQQRTCSSDCSSVSRAHSSDQAVCPAVFDAGRSGGGLSAAARNATPRCESVRTRHVERLQRRRRSRAGASTKALTKKISELCALRGSRA